MQKDFTQFEQRKRDHLQLALEASNQARGLAGLDSIRLVHEALPELDLNEIRLETQCLGRSLATPFNISGMTAGHADAVELNLRMARACEKRGWAFGVGSQRRALEAREKDADFEAIRRAAPEVFLIGNLGLSQLVSADPTRIPRGGDAIAIHLNSLQEALQPEGTPRFRRVPQARASGL